MVRACTVREYDLEETCTLKRLKLKCPRPTNPGRCHVRAIPSASGLGGGWVSDLKQ